MVAPAIKFEEQKEKLKQCGFFRYKDHYSNEPDLIYVSNITSQSKLKIRTTTFDGVFKRGEYVLNKNELTILTNMIKLAWQNNSCNYSCTISSNNKVITVKTEKSRTKLEKNKHMTIKINDICMAYGLDINDSRRFYKMLAEFINKKGSTVIS